MFPRVRQHKRSLNGSILEAIGLNTEGDLQVQVNHTITVDPNVIVFGCIGVAATYTVIQLIRKTAGLK